MNRPSWDEYFIKIAEDVSLRSTCLRHHFGAVIVNEKKEIVATGYNGAPRHMNHCTETTCSKSEKNGSKEHMKICRGAHAEINALLQAGKQAENCTLYVNGHPCRSCAKAIINAKIKRVVISGTYPEIEGVELLKEAGIIVSEYNRKEIKGEVSDI